LMPINTAARMSLRPFTRGRHLPQGDRDPDRDVDR
jgi:hypothetical protein